MTNVPTSINILVDSREKFPMLFPQNIRVPHPYENRDTVISVNTRIEALDSGDYSISDYPTLICIERKGSASEMYKNLFNIKDSQRQARSFKRMAAFKYRYLLIETSPSEILRSSTEWVPDPHKLMHHIGRIAIRYGLQLIWVPSCTTVQSRRALGTFLAHLMISHVYETILPISPLEVGGHSSGLAPLLSSPHTPSPEVQYV